MLVIFKKKPIKKLKVYIELHQLQILSIELIDSSILIKTKDQSIIIESSDALRLSKYFVRNYIFSTQTSPKRYSLQTISDNRDDFPQYSPIISPSQMVQFSFNSFCSLYKEKYKHRIIRFIHYFISAGNPVFDFSYTPLSILDENFINHSTFRSLFSAVLDLPIFNGIQCVNSNIPHFLTVLAEFFQNNSSVSILSLPNCNLKTGGKDLGNSFQVNQRSNLQYLDLSQNNIEDIGALAESLQYLNSPLFYLNLNDNFLNIGDTSNLFNNIVENRNLHSLTHILVNKSTINEQILTNFSQHISNLACQNRNILTYLDLGSINEGSDLLFQSLANNQVPLECLKIAGSKLNHDSIGHFNVFLSNAPFLQELDISNTNLDINEIGTVINSIQSNRKIIEFTLHVNSMKLCGKRLLEFTNKFADHSLSKWIGLGLEGNDIDVNDLQELNKFFQSMINLSWINLSCNFTSSMKKLDTELSKLLTIPRLNFIVLRGNMKKTLRGKKVKENEIKGKKAINNRALLSFISSLNELTRPIGLDLRFNGLKDEAIIKLGEAAANDKISELLLDCDRIKNIESVISLCNSISQSNSIISFNFPLSDFHSYLKPYKKRITSRNRHILSSKAHSVDNARIKALLNVMKNQTSFGYHSCLSFQHVSKLDKLIDELVIDMNSFLKDMRPFKHSIFSEMIGLPLPFQRGKEKASSATNVQNYRRIFSNGPGSYYYVPELLIREKGTNESMQFNSLCLRRPGATTSFQIPESINAMITDSFISLSSFNSNRNANSLDKSNAKNFNTLIKNQQTRTLVNDDNPYNSINFMNRNRRFNTINQPNSISRPSISKFSNPGVITDGLKIFEERDVRLTSESNTESFVRMKPENTMLSSSSNKERKRRSSKNHSSEGEKRIRSHKSQSSEGDRRIRSRRNQSSGSDKKIRSRNHTSDSDEYEYYEYLIEVEEEIEEEDGEYIEEIEYLYEDEEEEEEEKHLDAKSNKNEGRRDITENIEEIKKPMIKHSDIDLHNSSDSYDINRKYTRNSSDSEFIDLKRKNNHKIENRFSSDSFDDTNKRKPQKRNKNLQTSSSSDYDEDDFINLKRKEKAFGLSGRNINADKKGKNKGKTNKDFNHSYYADDDDDSFADTKRKNAFDRSGKKITVDKKGKINKNFNSDFTDDDDDFIHTKSKNAAKKENVFGRNINADKKVKNEGKTNKNFNNSYYADDDDDDDDDDFADTKQKNAFDRSGKKITVDKKGKNDGKKSKYNFNSDFTDYDDDFIDIKRKNSAKKENVFGQSGRNINADKKGKNEGKTNKNFNHNYYADDDDDFSGRKTTVDTKGKRNNNNFNSSLSDDEFIDTKRKNNYNIKNGKTSKKRNNNYSIESYSDDFIDKNKKNAAKKKNDDKKNINYESIYSDDFIDTKRRNFERNGKRNNRSESSDVDIDFFNSSVNNIYKRK